MTFFIPLIVATPLVDAVLAYVGPGPGLSLTWALLGLIATIATALFAILFWPVRVLIRKLRGGAAEATDAEAESAAGDATLNADAEVSDLPIDADAAGLGDDRPPSSHA